LTQHYELDCLILVTEYQGRRAQAKAKGFAMPMRAMFDKAPNLIDRANIAIPTPPSGKPPGFLSQRVRQRCLALRTSR